VDAGFERAGYSLSRIRQGSRGLFLLSVETLEKRRLTDGNDTRPAFSPDGRCLIFARGSVIHLLRLGADCERKDRRRGSSKQGTRTSTLQPGTSDGSQIVFSSGSTTSGNLWRIAAFASAEARRLPAATEDMGPLAVSRKATVWLRGTEVQAQHLEY